MSALTRFDRLEDLMADPFSDLFRRVMRRTDLPALRDGADIKIDVSETDERYTVKAEVPGAKKEDLRVQIEGNYVAISAEVKDEKETKDGERVLTRERYYGSMARGFTLACEVDDKNSAAVFKDGVLTLTLPKRAQAKGSVLQIS
ncbi:heat-shock protein Hsp20 [Pseudorhodoferax aquiterrae]|uniref:Heat-shock protein Hsp20 n=1 Tax=Pseudorhodoferax aquiterrae TaxID=747304 RepID=A0ABQ3G2R4_9BURK|nr:Hsp20 family protein [Pseudorhodoferax aquiterrae]GHC85767.1 heat-shock protein Hsp20 [Pseudorhodoferax aquiterrae]